MAPAKCARWPEAARAAGRRCRRAAAGLALGLAAGLAAYAVHAAPAIQATPAAQAAPASAAMPPGELLIEFSLAADGTMALRYTPPAGVRQWQLLNDTPAVRDFWRQQVSADPGCTRVHGLQISLVDDPACQQASLHVRPALLARRATYEAATPVSDTGVLLYTGFYAARSPGHGLRWRWHAPAGGHVLHQGRLHRQAVDQVVTAEAQATSLASTMDASASLLRGEHQYVYLGSAPALPLDGGVMVRDPALDEQRAQRIRDTLAQAMRALGQAYGQAPQGPVGVVAYTASTPGFQGDVTGERMMGLRLQRQPPTGEPDWPLQRFLAHEVAHWWNMGVHASDPARPWLHEGHADWVALLLLRQAGQLPDERAHALITDALHRCQLARGQRPAATLPSGWQADDDPYACGMVLMLLAQAQRAVDTGTPLQRLAGLHRAGQVLTEAGFAAWADGHTPAPGPMARLLQDPAVPFATGLLARLQALDLVDTQALAANQALPRDLQNNLGARLMRALMAADCAGTVSFWTLDAGFQLDGSVACRQLQPGGVVSQVAGLPAMGDVVGAWQAMASVCAHAPTVAVQYQDGRTGQATCPTPMPTLPAVQAVRLRPDALTRLGW
jgi:hypothetical protein